MNGPVSARPRRLPLAVLGLAIGTYSALCGIGGGVFAVPLLHYVHRIPLRTAVAESLVLVAASTTSATLIELAHPESALRLDMVLALVAGSLIGARLGFGLSRRVSTNGLKAWFAVFLAAIAVQMLVDGGTRDAFGAALAPQAALAPSQWALVAATGLVAGASAPIFGIGGGLVAVPILIHLFPDLGFLAARACSLAMSMVAALQSLFLYRQGGELKEPAALWLAGGGLVGAALGVQLVHVPAVTSAARGLVAFALAFAALRFGWDLWRARRASAG